MSGSPAGLRVGARLAAGLVDQSMVRSRHPPVAPVIVGRLRVDGRRRRFPRRHLDPVGDPPTDHAEFADG